MIITDNKEFKALAEFYLDYRGIEHDMVNIEINVEEYDICGEATAYDEYFMEVIINEDMDEEEQLLTLAHEMVHIGQYISGELDIETENVWRGEKIDVSLIDYEDRPWEKEAYELEEKIVKLFLISVK